MKKPTFQLNTLSIPPDESSDLAANLYELVEYLNDLENILASSSSELNATSVYRLISPVKLMASIIHCQAIDSKKSGGAS